MMLRERYSKKKIIGGKIGGNVFDLIRNLFFAGSKLIASKLPDMTKSFAVGAANVAGQKSASRVLEPTSTHKVVIDNVATDIKKAIPYDVKMTINDLANTPAVKKVLTDKTKQILSDDGRSLLANITTGTGLKNKNGSGMARIY